jgi:hypothetical protein
VTDRERVVVAIRGMAMGSVVAGSIEASRMLRAAADYIEHDVPSVLRPVSQRCDHHGMRGRRHAPHWLRSCPGGCP